MKSYYVDGLEKKEIYNNFIRLMIQNSDAFSIVYFKYNETRRLRATVKSIKQKLQPYKLHSERTMTMPSMSVDNDSLNVYNLTFYKATIDTEKILMLADTMWDWDYPNFPMDLCFFKNGYAWFVSSAHEKYAIIYTDDKEMISLLKRNNITLVFNEDIDVSTLYRNEKLIF